jgi:hypothetical protein
MKVTHQAIGEVISEMYDIKPIITEQYVAFYIQQSKYVVEVIICLDEDEPFCEDDDYNQSIEVWFWFCDENGGRLNLSKYSGKKIRAFCDKLKIHLEWSELLTLQSDKKRIGIALRRKDSIHIEDIRMAHDGNSRSCLLRVMYHTLSEWEKLSPLMHGYATNQIKPAYAEDLLAEPYGSC